MKLKNLRAILVNATSLFNVSQRLVSRLVELRIELTQSVKENTDHTNRANASVFRSNLLPDRLGVKRKLILF